MQPLKFTLRLAVKARIRYLLSIRSREKVLCANVNTDSRLRNTFYRVWHFADDKAIPATCRLFQRDLFRVSDKRTVHSDFDFCEFWRGVARLHRESVVPLGIPTVTLSLQRLARPMGWLPEAQSTSPKSETEFWHFQSIIPCVCFTNRILTNTFRLSQAPRHRANRTLKSRVSLFLRIFFTSRKKVLVRLINAFDGRYLHILRMLVSVMRVFTEFHKVVDLVVHRHRYTAIIPHLRTHLKHIVVQLLLIFQLRKKPSLLIKCRIHPIFECALH